jgi:hypothetical protein
MKIKECYVLVTWAIGEDFVYKITFKKEIERDEGHEKILKYFIKKEGWNEDRDGLEIFDELNEIKL